MLSDIMNSTTVHFVLFVQLLNSIQLSFWESIIYCCNLFLNEYDARDK